MKKSRFIFENNETPKVGGFLLSDPFQGDAYFERSVVYLCQYDEEGVFGFVLNNPLNLTMGDVIEDSPFAEYPIFIGGPVSKNQLFFLHNLGHQVPHSLDCGNGVFFSGDFDALKECYDNLNFSSYRVRFFVGYSGWDSGQLEEEIENHSWIAVNNLASGYIFHDNSKDLWKECMEAQGAKFKIIARFPKNPSDN
jgi:putative transcriptional regulator